MHAGRHEVADDAGGLHGVQQVPGVLADARSERPLVRLHGQDGFLELIRRLDFSEFTAHRLRRRYRRTHQ